VNSVSNIKTAEQAILTMQTVGVHAAKGINKPNWSLLLPWLDSVLEGLLQDPDITCPKCGAALDALHLWETVVVKQEVRQFRECNMCNEKFTVNYKMVYDKITKEAPCSNQKQ